MPDLGPAELIIVLLVVVMIFGGSRLAEIGGSLGRGIREFKNAVNEDDAPEATTATPTPLAAGPAGVTAASIRCETCSAENIAGAHFCAECGAALAPVEAPSTAEVAPPVEV